MSCGHTDPKIIEFLVPKLRKLSLDPAVATKSPPAWSTIVSGPRWNVRWWWSSLRTSARPRTLTNSSGTLSNRKVRLATWWIKSVLRRSVILGTITSQNERISRHILLSTSARAMSKNAILESWPAKAYSTTTKVQLKRARLSSRYGNSWLVHGNLSNILLITKNDPSWKVYSMGKDAGGIIVYNDSGSMSANCGFQVNHIAELTISIVAAERNLPRLAGITWRTRVHFIWTRVEMKLYCNTIWRILASQTGSVIRREDLWNQERGWGAIFDAGPRERNNSDGWDEDYATSLA